MKTNERALDWLEEEPLGAIAGIELLTVRLPASLLEALQLTEKSDDETCGFIEKLWAVRRVGEILEELDLKGKNDELITDW